LLKIPFCGILSFMAIGPRDNETFPSIELLVQEAGDLQKTVLDVIDEFGEERFVQAVTQRIQDPQTTPEELLESQAFLLTYAEHMQKDDLAERHTADMVIGLRAQERYGVSAFASSILFQLQLESGKPHQAVTTLLEGYDDCLRFEAGEDVNETRALSTHVREYLATSFYKAPINMAQYLQDKPDMRADVIEYCNTGAARVVNIEQEAFIRNILIAIYGMGEEYDEVEAQAERLETLSVQRGRLAEAFMMGANVARIAASKKDFAKTQTAIARLRGYRTSLLNDPNNDAEALKQLDNDLAELMAEIEPEK
jgi:hypothetical protein